MSFPVYFYICVCTTHTFVQHCNIYFAIACNTMHTFKQIVHKTISPSVTFSSRTSKPQRSVKPHQSNHTFLTQTTTTRSSVQCRIFKWESLFGGGDAQTQEQEAVLIPNDELPFPPDIILADTFLEGKALAQAYKASEDGWGALTFHDKWFVC